MILYLIPARGGSKRLPGKNLRKLAGIPLVAWAIRRAQGAARLVGGESRVVVSTDSADIARVATEWGAQVLMRPDIYSTDEATSEAVALHALSTYADDIRSVVLVQPTSPLSSVSGLAMLARTMGAAKLTKKGEPTGGGYKRSAVDLAAGRQFAFYEGDWGDVPDVPYVYAVDIDTEDDWKMAEALLAAREVAPFEIAGRKIGPGHPCFVIAEAGINHGGSEEQAHALIDAAADAGADAVKFQTFNPHRLAEPGPHRDMLLKVMLYGKAWQPLQDHAEKRGLIFLSSVFDENDVDLMDSYRVPAFKIPSGEIINLPLLRHVASKGKPVILSTGMSTMREVAAAVDALSGVPLALLHCVSDYPTQPSHANLAAMETMRQAFGLPVGWSDHTEHAVVGAVAAAMGACIVEKHICLPGYDGPDWKVSSDMSDFFAMKLGISHAQACRGTGEKIPTANELETAKVARRRDGLRRNAS